METKESADEKATALPCGHCGETAIQQCGQCKNMRYCSLECRQADWRVHKYTCKQHPCQFEGKKPKENTRLAIVLNPEGGEPLLIWIECVEGVKARPASVITDDKDEASVAEAKARNAAKELDVPLNDDTNKTFFGKPNTLGGLCRVKGAPTMLVCGKRGNGQLLDYSIHVVSTTARWPQMQDPNECLRRFLGDEAVTHWPGGFLIYAITKVYDSSTIVNIDTRGLTLALDVMAAYGREGPPLPKKIQGVRGLVSKAIQLNGPALHQVHTYKQSASTKASVPASPRDANDPLNPAAWLQLAVDPESSDFGKIPVALNNDPSSLLVVRSRSNGKYLPTEASWIKALIRIVRDSMSALMGDSSKTPRERLELVRARSAHYFDIFESTNPAEMAKLVEMVEAADMAEDMQGKNWASKGAQATSAEVKDDGEGEAEQN